MRALGIAICWGCWITSSVRATDAGRVIADFEGANPLAGWAASGAGSLTAGAGHAGHGARLEYQFPCCRGGSAAATWTPERPVATRRKGAISLWIQASPEVRISLVVTDAKEGVRRYPFEVTTLEHNGAEWRQVVVPLAAKSTGYGDEDHNGAPQGRLTALSIVAEARYPMALHGVVAFDDLRVLDSPDQNFSLSPSATLAPAPPDSARLAPRLGVNIHVLNDAQALDAARDAGFTFVRVDLLWRQVERNGRLRFVAYDRLLAELEARSMGALWILDYGHPQHGGDPPRREEDVAAFARFCGAAAEHYKGRGVRFEIWNEPDTERFWPPAPKAGEYARLLRPAVTAMHEADPAARVATGGVARMDVPFLAAVLDAAGRDGISAVAVHPYRKSGPEGVAAELPLVRAVATDAEVWDTEWGYASYDYFSQNLHGEGHSAAGRMRQAVMACREALTVWALGLPVAVWYDLRDDGEETRNPEHNYGLLDRQGADKPAMKALRELTSIARDHTFAGMVVDVPDGAHAMRLDGSADRVFAVWNEQPDARITITVPAEGLISAVDLMGEAVKLKGKGQLVLVETAGPVFLKFRL